MKKNYLYVLTCFILCALNTGYGNFHLWDINEVYSNADGSVQFIELFTSSNGQEVLTGHEITSTGADDYTFPSNSPTPTAGHHLLLATGDINGVTPDFIIPANFLTTGPGMVNFAGVDSLSYSSLPINGFSSVDGNGDINATATPTNFSGSTTTLTGSGSPMTFTVNSTDDVDDSTCDGTHCSLREAINAANANAGLDTIAFDISGSGPHSIAPTSALPLITDPVVIDGATEPDFTGTPVIELNGTNAGASSNGLKITGGDSTVRALVVNRFGIDGIVLETNGSNRIEGCYIGTSTDGMSALGNSEDGVYVSSSPDNIIGGTTASARNVISGNGDDGIDFSDGSTGNMALGNYLGTNATGTAAIGNGSDGVEIDYANGNFVGGSADGARNIISGNSSEGISLSDCSGNIIRGNYIGTDVTGDVDLGNSSYGIDILDLAINNTIGGAGAGEGNVISGNGEEGILIANDGTTGNMILGNYIGTNASGTAALGNDQDGIEIENFASGNTIGGTAAGAGNLISGNGDDGIDIDEGASGNMVLGNYIGTDVTGTQAIGNANDGVELDTDSANNIIGGSAAGARNVISGNIYSGVYLSGSGTTGNTIAGNYIGTDKDGSFSVSNGDGGIVLSSEANHNTIGGTEAGAGNLISGNLENGIEMHSTGTSNNMVLGNYIGTNASGTAALGNSNDGVEIEDFASNNTIGGTSAGAGNLISGNVYDGIDIDDGASGNMVLGNYIGTDVTGMTAIGNADDGVELDTDSTNNIIGGSTAGARNVISGNGYSGVYLSGSGTMGNTIAGNYVGTDKDGISPVGNNDGGVVLSSDANNNTIGGTDTGAGNLIAHNIGHGVEIHSDATTGNRVLGNSIHSNSLLGIDLGGDTVNGNDSGDADSGSNNLQNSPEIAAASTDVNDDLLIEYSVDSDPGNSAYPLTIEFFVSDPSGEGQVYLGMDTYSDTDHASGVKSINLGGVLPPQGITDQTNSIVATATDFNGNTSEFSTIDTDTDGMPNAWEEYWGLDYDDLTDGPKNPDGDAFTNFEEFLSGTDPFDIASALRITEIVFSGADFSISFTTSVSRRYAVLYTDDLTAGVWMTLDDGIPGTGDIVQATDTGVSGQTARIYQVQVSD